MAIKTTKYVIQANITVCCISFWVPSFARTLASLSPPQFPCSHLLATGIMVSKQYWYWVWQPTRVLPNTQYYPILENIGQYPIPQCQYRSNPKNEYSVSECVCVLTSGWLHSTDVLCLSRSRVGCWSSHCSRLSCQCIGIGLITHHYFPALTD